MAPSIPFRRRFLRSRNDIKRLRRAFRPTLESVETRTLLSGYTFTVNSLGDTGAGSGLYGDLRYALTEADSYPGSTIDFAVTGTLQLSRALPDITANMTINGPGDSRLTVKGGGPSSNFSVFTVEAGVTASLTNITIAGGNARYGGGIYDLGTLTLTNSTLSGNSAVLGAGLFDNGSVTLSGTIISGNTSSSMGGGIFNHGTLAANNLVSTSGGLTVTRVTNVSNNTAWYDGGGIFSSGNSLTLSGTTLANDKATSKYGGAIRDLSTLTLTNCNLLRNSAVLGGGLYEVDGAATLSNTSVSGNSAGSMGGGIFFDGTTMSVTGGSISGNTAWYHGGGILSEGNSLTLSGTTLANDKATSKYGGAIWDLSALTLTNCNLLGNSAVLGGGLYEVDGAATLSNTTVSGNTAGSMGGGIFFDGTTMSVTGGSISGNTAWYHGGGILSEGGSLTVSGTSIANNRVNKYGGGIWDSSVLTLTNCSLAGNRAGAGGGLYLPDGTATLSGTTVTGNTANTGGGLFNHGTLAVTGGAVSGNTATYNGGGIFSFGNSLTLNGTTLANNTAAKDYGGGIYAATAVTLTNCSLAGNSAVLGGPGIYASNAVTVNRSTLSASFGPIQDFLVDSNGNVYFLTASGNLYENPPSSNSLIDQHVYSISVGAGGQLSILFCTPPISYSSSNWSGYVAETNLRQPQTNSVTSVGGTWNVPAVTGPSSGSTYSSVWVGIDGFNGSTVEQVGTSQNVVNGRPVYYAWYEMYSTGAGQPEQIISSMTVLPGDSITALVQYNTTGAHAGQFQLSIIDHSHANDSFITYQSSSQTQNPQPQRNCTEWIIEAPSNGVSTLPLANFGSVAFTHTWATIDGVVNAINSPAWQSAQVNMFSNGVTEDSTSTLTNTAATTSFSVTFRASIGNSVTSGTSTGSVATSPFEESGASRSIALNTTTPPRRCTALSQASSRRVAQSATWRS